jgi:hypothetical protein
MWQMWGNVTFKEKEIAYWKMVEQGVMEINITKMMSIIFCF